MSTIVSLLMPALFLTKSACTFFYLRRNDISPYQTFDKIRLLKYVDLAFLNTWNSPSNHFSGCKFGKCLVRPREYKTGIVGSHLSLLLYYIISRLFSFYHFTSPSNLERQACFGFLKHDQTQHHDWIFNKFLNLKIRRLFLFILFELI